MDRVSIVWKQLNCIWGKSLLHESSVLPQLLLRLPPPKKEGKLKGYFSKVTRQIWVERHERAQKGMPSAAKRTLAITITPTHSLIRKVIMVTIKITNKAWSNQRSVIGPRGGEMVLTSFPAERQAECPGKRRRTCLQSHGALWGQGQARTGCSSDSPHSEGREPVSTRALASPPKTEVSR